MSGFEAVFGWQDPRKMEILGKIRDFSPEDLRRMPGIAKYERFFRECALARYKGLRQS